MDNITSAKPGVPEGNVSGPQPITLYNPLCITCGDDITLMRWCLRSVIDSKDDADYDNSETKSCCLATLNSQKMYL